MRVLAAAQGMRWWLALLVFLSLGGTAVARPGDLDTTFGNGGVFVGPENSNIASIQRVVLQPDGSLLALGVGPRFGSYGSVVARLRPSGEFDPAFGWEGHAPSNLAPAVELMRQPDGKIVVAGEIHPGQRQLGELATERFLPNGDPDPSFGSEGRASVHSGSEAHDYATAAALDSRGRIVVAGYAYGGAGSYLVFARFLPDGSLDPSFGVNGVVKRGRTLNLTIRDVEILPDGRLLASGGGYDGVPFPALLRMTPDGSPDKTFGGDGLITMRGHEGFYIRRTFALPGGKILAAGARFSGYGHAAVLTARFLRDGRVDRTYARYGVGEAGLGVTDDEGGIDAIDMARQPDGKIAVVATIGRCRVRGPCESRVVVTRLRSDGGIDREFGVDGLVKRRYGASLERLYYGSLPFDVGTTAVLLADERLLIGGSALRTRPAERGGTRSEYLLARFTDTVAPRLATAVPKRLRLRGGAVRLRVGCSEMGPTCAGRLRIMVGGRMVGNRVFALRPGIPASIAVSISRRGRRTVRSERRVRVHSVLRLRDSNDNSSTRSYRIVLLPARRTAGASAAAPARFFGMHADQAFAASGESREAILRDVRATGAGVIRQQLDWSQVEREPGVYDWSEFDAYAEAVARADLDLMPILIAPPAFRSQAPANPRRGLYPPRRAREFGEFAAAAVARYRPGGTFWIERPGLPQRPIRDWQVWNEPSLGYFWRPKPNARAFGRMLRVVADAIHRADPRARVIAPALPESRYGVPLMRYLSRMSAAAGRRGYDVAAVNPYARDVPEMMRLLRGTRRWLDRHRRARLPILVSEFGWASFDDREEWLQARRVGGAVRALDRERRRLRLSGAIHYSWQDADPFPGGADFWGIHTGLFDRSGRPKPAWNVFRQEVGRATR